MKIEHPLLPGRFPIQRVLRDLASQENCDGDPYDQMIQAADYIDELEGRLDFFRTKIKQWTGEFLV